MKINTHLLHNLPKVMVGEILGLEGTNGKIKQQLNTSIYLLYDVVEGIKDK